MLQRQLEKNITDKLFDKKTILLLGARQVGKSTLLKNLSEKWEHKINWLNGDVARDRLLLKNITPEHAQQLFPKKSILIIDEVQRLDESGLTLKIIHDYCPEVQIIATGSSSFEITDKIKEPLTGRYWTLNLFPISQQELIYHQGTLKTQNELETRLIFGSYPDIINRTGNEQEALETLTSDYLLKDVFALYDIRKSDALEKLLQALAYQVGHQVSFRELSQLTEIDKETVERYINMLESAFIVFRLPSYASNLRNELKRSKKIYFFDNGVRNALIGNYNPLTLRNDVGQLWENFLMAERYKLLSYNKSKAKTYFWRTTSQQEIDYLEIDSKEVSAYEFKWNSKKKFKFPNKFMSTYEPGINSVITPNNYLPFVLNYEG